MPGDRRQAALTIVHEVLATNDVQDFYWYKPKRTPELSCYWDDADRNLLWVTSIGVHVRNDPSVELPARPTNWSKEDCKYVGWLLPGGEAGTGGGRTKTLVPEVLCPETHLRVPAGQLCPDCEILHA